MGNFRVHPIHLGTFKNVDWSHSILNTRFGEKMDAAALSYLVEDGSNLLIVDVGFDVHRDNFNLDGDPVRAFSEKFSALGYEFEQVKSIIITHLHWDHVAHTSLFPSARIYIQRREMEVAAAPLYPLYYYASDVSRLIGVEGHRIVYLDGDTEILPGVRAVFAGGHTLGSQMVFVQTSKGTAIITGDICNLYENLEVRSVKEVDVMAWVRAVDKIKREGDVILPMHDLRVLERYPLVGD